MREELKAMMIKGREEKMVLSRKTEELSGREEEVSLKVSRRKRASAHHHLLPLMLFFFAHAVSSSSPANDTTTLLLFKKSADPSGFLLPSWNSNNCCSPPSSWIGVSCLQNRVSRLSLAGFNLSGSVLSLSSLTELRVLVLSSNNLDGSLPNLTSWNLLWQLNLSGNRLSGPIPDSISSLPRLWRLDLSSNRLNGSIPSSLNRLTRLLTLRLQHNELSGSIPLFTISSLTDLSLQNNHLSGKIPPLELARLTAFDVSGNNLSGEIPSSLVKFPLSSFSRNGKLCGVPLPACGGNQVSSSPASPFVPSSPSVGPPVVTRRKGPSKLSLGAIIAIVIGDVIMLLVLAILFVLYYGRKTDQTEKNLKQDDGDKGVWTPGHYGALQVPDSERSKLVFFDRRKQFELEDLLRASAEMLGKGSFGTAYKAVLEDGSGVAVKRLKDVNSSGKKEFEQQMELIGRLTHPNLVPLRAYYFAKEEKLLVYDLMPNGSLHSLLHGNRGPGRVPLDWTTRVKIVLGAARGLAHIHQEWSTQKIPHGNFKSSNVLLDKNGTACVSDFGLSLLMNSSAAASRLIGYRAPEHIDNKKVSQRADVYSFGVLLLEILTGKIPAQSLQDEGIDLPKWVQSVVREEWTAEVFDLELMRYKNIEEEMVAMLQIAMMCVSASPDQRPKMMQVVKMIEDIRGEQSPARDESLDGSVNNSPAVSEEAGTTSY